MYWALVHQTSEPHRRVRIIREETMWWRVNINAPLAYANLCMRGNEFSVFAIVFSMWWRKVSFCLI